MISVGLQLVLLLFGMVGFAGAGASLAVWRMREISEGERDSGILGGALLLAVFGTFSTLIGAGVAGVFGFGLVVGWVAYVLTAQRIGLLRVEAGGRPYPEWEPTEEHRRLT